MKHVTVLIMALVIVSLPLWAGSIDKPFFSPVLPATTGLLNMNNMQMNHSLSFMSGFSSTGEGFYQSVYTNHLLYKFNPKLDLRIDLNFVNNGTANWDKDFSVSSNQDNANNIIPEFSLTFRPNENSLISFEYRQYATPYQSSNNWRW